MKIIKIFLISIIFINYETLFANEKLDLCLPGETIAFNCILKNRKIGSLCASKDISKTTGYFIYRFGKKDAIELQYPSRIYNGTHPFNFAGDFYSGGSEQSVSFHNGDYTYTLTVDALRTNFTGNGVNNLNPDGKIIIQRPPINGHKELEATYLCRNKSFYISDDAGEYLPSEQ